MNIPAYEAPCLTSAPPRSVLRLLQAALDDPAARFRDGQWQAIDQLVNHQSRLLVVERTGWGKSLVYFMATRLLRERGKGPTLLISPLLALMRNQILAAERIDVRAATVNSSNQAEWDSILADLQDDSIDILLISPERLANETFREDYLLPIAHRIGLFVVDEAHCISDWGHDFRPDYRRITRVLQALPPNVPVLATTATANDRVVADVVGQLGTGVQLIRGSLMRDSLTLQNIHLPGQAARLAWLAEQLTHLPGSGIIYTLTTKDAERVADWLRQNQIVANAYHGGMDGELREELEQQLLDNRVKALVATSALGMGFDKPDLGFVVHFHRPGSVVHYYQQVGRAGRAVDHAYGIMLSGDEDDDIIDYFITKAFPPDVHIAEILGQLEAADQGLSLTDLERRTNLRRSDIQHVLKLLTVETPAPVSKRGSSWFSNPVTYRPDQQRIARITQQRRQEQEQMRQYLHSQECLMHFLGRALDDPTIDICGRCAVCRGQPVLSATYDNALAIAATAFLRRQNQVIEPRKMWPGDALLAAYGWKGKIAPHLKFEAGRALCLWGDAGWGDLVRRGKQNNGRFDDELLHGAVALIQECWRPTPAPEWVTCVPSVRHPSLVSDFARRLALALDLPFVSAIQRLQHTEPQKTMRNSFRQAQNLAGAFTVTRTEHLSRPVLLVDDIVDSRWTFTVLAALLREAGSGPVFPLALAEIIAEAE